MIRPLVFIFLRVVELIVSTFAPVTGVVLGLALEPLYDRLRPPGPPWTPTTDLRVVCPAVSP